MKYMRHLQSLRKNIALLVVLMAIGYSCLAQNLVPNGSFEEGITCPSFVGNVTDECAEWYASVSSETEFPSSPDWFHSCSEYDFFQPPEVAFGIQETADGNGYVGMITYSLSTADPNYREIIGVELTTPLVIGEVYLVEFKISSLAFPGTAVSSNNIGFNFSSHPFYDRLDFPINSSHYSIDSFVSVSDDWTQVSVVFEADSAYSFLHIGNFYDDENTEIVIESDISTSAYYAIDEVVVSTSLTNTVAVRKYEKPKIYPNPVLDELTIQMPENEEAANIALISLSGMLMSNWKYQKANTISLDLSKFQSGMYLMQIVTPKTIYYERFIKQ